MPANLDQLRDDLAAVRAAAGLEPVWNRGAIRTHLLLTAAGIAAATWAVLPHGLSEIAGFAAFAIPVADWAWRYGIRSTHTAAEDREWREAAAVMWYAVPLSALALWSRAVGLNAVTMAGLMLFMIGLVLFGPAVSERGQRPLLGWAIAFMIGGLVAPLRVASFVPVVGLAIALGAIVSAAWIAVDLRRADAR